MGVTPSRPAQVARPEPGRLVDAHAQTRPVVLVERCQPAVEPVSTRPSRSYPATVGGGRRADAPAESRRPPGHGARAGGRSGQEERMHRLVVVLAQAGGRGTGGGRVSYSPDWSLFSAGQHLVQEGLNLLAAPGRGERPCTVTAARRQDRTAGPSTGRGVAGWCWPRWPASPPASWSGPGPAGLASAAGGRSSSRCRSHLIPAEAESGLRREFHWMRIRDELRTSSGESSALPPPTWCSRRLGPEAAT